MKLLKVLLSSAVAVALVLGVAGCSADDDEGAFSGQTVDFDNSYVIVDSDGNVSHAESATDTDKAGNIAQANSTYYYRAFKKFATKHYGGTCVITIAPQQSSGQDGVAGFVFDLTKNDDTTYNFLVAAVRYDATNKLLGTYISKYTNASVKDNNYTKESNFTDIDGAKITTTANDNKAIEEELLKGSSSNSSSTVYYDFSKNEFAVDDDGNVVVAIKVEQDEISGAYTVSYYKSLDDSKDDVNPVYSKVLSDKVQSGYKQGEMWMYANIYPGKQFWADFSLKDKVGNDVPLESEVVEE